jgi:hypothetical protein
MTTTKRERMDEKKELLEKLAGSLKTAEPERAIVTRYLIEWLQKNVKMEYTYRTIKIDLPIYLDRAWKELERGRYVDATPLARRYLPQYEKVSGIYLRQHPIMRTFGCEQELLEEIVTDMFDVDTAANVRAYFQAEWHMVRRAWMEFSEEVFSQGLFEILDRIPSGHGQIGECDITHFCSGPPSDNRLITIENARRKSADFSGRRKDTEGLTFVLGQCSMPAIEICRLLKTACKAWSKDRDVHFNHTILS